MSVFQCDNKRGNYALKESKLASVWSNACGFNPKTTARGKSAVAWKSSGTEGAGNFSAVMYGVRHMKYHACSSAYIVMHEMQSAAMPQTYQSRYSFTCMLWQPKLAWFPDFLTAHLLC